MGTGKTRVIYNFANFFLKKSYYLNIYSSHYLARRLPFAKRGPEKGGARLHLPKYHNTSRYDG
jgi:hypothetical protein